MSELGPEARALIDDADGVDAPSPVHRENVRAKLAAQLGVAAAGAAAVAKAGTTGASAKVGATLFGSAAALLAAKVLVGALAIAVTAAVLVTVRSSNAPDVVTAPVPANGAGGSGVGGNGTGANASTADTQSAPELEAPASPANPAVPPPARAASRSATMRPATGDAPLPVNAPAAAPSARGAELEGEVALFTKVRAAIDAGNGAAALALLDRHEKLYPNGVLADQRAVERVIALCAIGRVPASREAAARFLAEHPRSSKAAEVRSACGVP